MADQRRTFHIPWYPGQSVDAFQLGSSAHYGLLMGDDAAQRRLRANAGTGAASLPFSGTALGLAAEPAREWPKAVL